MPKSNIKSKFNKNIKSLIKSIVRVVWKIFLRPISKLLPNNEFKSQIITIGNKIERRQWWLDPQNTTNSSANTINNFLFEELRDLSQFEFLLQPTNDFIHQISTQIYDPSTDLNPTSIGQSYDAIIKNLRNLDFDVIFLAPWLKRGGADLGLLHHINACHVKNYNILLITTLEANSTWLYKLPDSAKHLDLSLFARNLNENQQAELLARILLQSSAQTIHNINSDLGWFVSKHYGSLFKAMNKNLFVSIFCEDKIDDNYSFGYAPKYLGDTYQFLAGIFCDTKWYPRVIEETTGLDSELVHTVYFPFLGNINTINITENAPILWASRIASQKRPSILYDIAKRMPKKTFHVYGECDPQCANELEKLKSLPNIKYFGKYNSFNQILLENKFSAFLYTSGYDGLPNVLIEAIASGIPAIAYDVGGIAELLSPQVLLSDNQLINVNLKKINNILQKKDMLVSSWEYSKDILENRHSWHHFVSTLENIDGYFPKMSSDEYRSLHSNMRVLSKPNL